MTAVTILKCVECDILKVCFFHINLEKNKVLFELSF